MKIVFFDGTCNLCNGFVDWLIRHDRKDTFQFASLQGTSAFALLPKEFRHRTEDLTTVLYFRDAVVAMKSTAVLLILQDLGGPWKFLRIFQFMPLFLRDLIYDQVAQYRYQIFGKRQTCRVPTEQERGRILP